MELIHIANATFSFELFSQKTRSFRFENSALNKKLSRLLKSDTMSEDIMRSIESIF